MLKFPGKCVLMPSRLLNYPLNLGNSSIEAAIDWLVDHENDPAATEMQMVGFRFIFAAVDACMNLFCTCSCIVSSILLQRNCILRNALILPHLKTAS